ncbi:MAG: exopolysaccharide biosynthesis protein [Pararhizobium sp.]
MTDTFATAAQPRTGARSHPQQLSQLLRNVSLTAGPKITLRDLAVAMEDRSFGAFLVVFALPNLIPLPPGSTFILGLPLIFVAWQMLASRHTRIWLPKRMGDYAFENATFFVFVNRISPWLQRAETLIKPRVWFLGGRLAERLIGLLALILAIVIFLPIPFGNWLPAFALAVIGFAHMERDGFGLMAGALIGIVSLFVAGAIIAAAGAVLTFIV